MPVAPRFHSGCQAQVSALGSDGASNHPLGVSRSERPSPLTSPVPTPWPAAAVPKSCFFQSRDHVIGPLPRTSGRVPDDDVGRVGQDVELAVAVDVDQDGGLARAGLVDLVVDPLGPLLAGVLDPEDVLAEVGDGDEVHPAVAVDVVG